MVGGVLGTILPPRLAISIPMNIAAPIMMAAMANPLNTTVSYSAAAALTRTDRAAPQLTMGLVVTRSLLIGIMKSQAAVTTTFPLRT